MSNKALVTAIQRFSLNDGPGIRTTVFFKGCNLSCAWCHNPETIRCANELMTHPEKCIGCGHCLEVCSSGAHFALPGGGVGFDRARCTGCGKCAGICFPGAMEMAARELSVEEVMAEIRQDLAYYRDSGGGVTLSGGEIFCQAEFAAELVSACRAEKIPVAVETNLYWEFSRMEAVLKNLDMVMFDLKLADCAAHRQWTGAGNELIIANLASLDALNIPLIARTPLIPEVTDSPANITAIAALLKPLKNLVRYELLNFNPLGDAKYTALAQDNPFRSAPAIPDARLQELLELAGKTVKTVLG